jgi:UDP-2,3-diacylglucosamine pyrophosphatase LpxH
MSNIKYVCLSDLHFGQDNSLLTNLKTENDDYKPGDVTKEEKTIDPTKPSPSLIAFCDCLKEFVSGNSNNVKPTLILNGDIMELALAESMGDAAMAFERFVELALIKHDLFEKDIIYIPGNHDHHFWELARENQYTEFISKRVSVGDPLPAPWHTTRMLLEKESPRGYFLTKLMHRYDELADYEVKIKYPNLGIFEKVNKRCVIITHGHYIESIYKLMTKAFSKIFRRKTPPKDIREIEKENFAWIDFFWSTMGRSGDVGEGVKLIYESLENEKARNKLIGNLAEWADEEVKLPWLLEKLDERIFKAILKWVAKEIIKREKKGVNFPLSEDALEGFKEYLEGPIHIQLSEELEKINEKIPEDVSFCFGHTHKPYEKEYKYSGYPGMINVYNSGGWVVEDVKLEPKLGAAAILMDEELNTASVRFYNEGSYKVDVAKAIRGETTPFHDHLQNVIKNSQPVFNKFEAVAKQAVDKRAELLKMRLENNLREKKIPAYDK